MVCRWCKKEYKEPVVDGRVESCPHCEGVYPEKYLATSHKDVWFHNERKEDG